MYGNQEVYEGPARRSQRCRKEQRGLQKDSTEERGSVKGSLSSYVLKQNVQEITLLQTLVPTVNLMDDEFLQRILQDGGKVTIKELKEPRLLNVQVSFRKVATMHMELRIRHGKTLVLRNVNWTIT